MSVCVNVVGFFFNNTEYMRKNFESLDENYDEIFATSKGSWSSVEMVLCE
jgi:hypothetical protein